MRVERVPHSAHGSSRASAPEYQCRMSSEQSEGPRVSLPYLRNALCQGTAFRACPEQALSAARCASNGCPKSWRAASSLLPQAAAEVLAPQRPSAAAQLSGQRLLKLLYELLRLLELSQHLLITLHGGERRPRISLQRLRKLIDVPNQPLSPL